jgi:uncharacterized protein involved in exopolysaccharide biosynthesis
MNDNKPLINDDVYDLERDEIDLAGLLRLILRKKLIIALFIIFSIPFSVFYASTITPIFNAISVFEKPGKENAGIDSVSQDGLSLVSLIGGGNLKADTSNHLAVIDSDSFLRTVVLDNEKIDKANLTKFCPSYIAPSRVSFRAVLESIGLSEIIVPNSAQDLDLVFKCVRRLINLSFHRYEGVETKAVKVTVSSPSAEFSANLANQVVEKYFLWVEKQRKENFNNIKDYLSDTISETQAELSDAKNLLQDFLIKHALLGVISVSTNLSDFGVVASKENPFRIEMQKQIANLGQLKKSQAQFKQVKSQLSNLGRENSEEVAKFVSSLDAQEVLARNFVSTVLKIANSSNENNLGSLDLLEALKEELLSLEAQIKDFEKRIEEKERETVELMNIENRYQRLVIDAEKRLIIFESLKDQLNKKIIEAGLSDVSEPMLLTEAVP